jgi:type IV secretion system protein VirD4
VTAGSPTAPLPAGGGSPPRPGPAGPALGTGPEMGIYLGIGAGGWVWAGPERSTLVLGPSRSGKTSSLIVPNVLAARGAVVSTSTKPDVLQATSRTRSERGWTLLYDPSGTVAAPPGVERVGWSPVNACSEWDSSLLVAEAMVTSARPSPGARFGAPGDGHWSERAASLLAPILHAAAIDGAPMSQVLSWVDRHHGAEALEVLSARGGSACAGTDLLAGLLTTDPREQSGIWSTASGVLAAYRSTSALASTEPPFFDPGSFCAGANTLYVCATGRHQQHLAPLVVGVLSDIRDAAYQRASDGEQHPPVLFALDEVANMAPIPDLPQMVSEGAGQGLLTLASLQDLAQARTRWGQEADAFVSLFGTTVVLGGLADMATLEALSVLGGEVEVPTRTVSTATDLRGRRRPGQSISTVRRRRVPVEVIARGRPDTALALDAHNRIGWVGLTPAHRSLPWRELLGPGRDRTRRWAGSLVDQSRPRER